MSRAFFWSETLVIVSRLHVPMSFLTASLVVTFSYLDRTVPYLADGGAPWIKWSHVLLSVVFLLTQLTNRRYGPSYAFVQILLSLAICDTLAAVRPEFVKSLLPAVAMPSAREAAAFIGAFIASGFLSAVAFDAARGPRWWAAPLTSSYVSSVVFALLFYPLAYAGSGVDWAGHMSTHAGILIAASVFGLFPYWLLRPVIKPLPGFAGH